MFYLFYFNINGDKIQISNIDISINDRRKIIRKEAYLSVVKDYEF